MNTPARCLFTLAALVSIQGAACNPPSTSASSQGAGAPLNPPKDSASQEPFVLEGFEDWQRKVESEGEHRLEILKPKAAQDGACELRLERWSSLPPTPGGPMKAESEREVTVSGQKLMLVTTSLFQGVADVVEVLFLRSGPAYGRLVLRQCPKDVTERALASLVIKPEP